MVGFGVSFGPLPCGVDCCLGGLNTLGCWGYLVFFGTILHGKKNQSRVPLSAS